MIEDRERKTGREILLILIKGTVYLLLVFFYISKPLLYLKYPDVEKISGAVMVFLGPSLIISVIRLIIIYWYIKKHRFRSNVKDNFILGINRIESILNVVFVVIAGTTFFDLDPKQFIFNISIVAAALAVTFKDYINNMINGLIIMFSDRLSLGDHIKVGEHEGKILDITLINMILQNEDNDMMIIPNAVAFNTVIINQSKQNIKKLSIEFDMSLKNGYTPEYLENYLNRVIASYSGNVVDKGLTVKTIAINKDAAVFKAMILLKQYDKVKEREIRRAINTALIRLSATLHKDKEIGTEEEKQAL
jgi:small-conductance mechanosensitive channel